MSYEKTEVPGILKDKETGVLINTNESDLTSFRKQRAAIKERAALKAEVERLKKEQAELKEQVTRVFYELGILKAGSDRP